MLRCEGGARKSGRSAGHVRFGGRFQMLERQSKALEVSSQRIERELPGDLGVRDVLRQNRGSQPFAGVDLKISPARQPGNVSETLFVEKPAGLEVRIHARF